MMQAGVRRANVEDAGVVAGLNSHVQGWHAAHYPAVFHATPDRDALTAHFARRLAETDVTCLLAGDPAQGYVLCVLQVRPPSVFSPGIRRLLVDHVAVAPEVRRQGVGSALLACARGLARDLECEEILVDTWEANHAAQAFFGASGFAVRRMLFCATP